MTKGRKTTPVTDTAPTRPGRRGGTTGGGELRALDFRGTVGLTKDVLLDNSMVKGRLRVP